MTLQSKESLFKKSLRLLVFTGATLVVSCGCEQSNLGTLSNSAGLPPQILQVVLTPNAINIDSLASVGDASPIATIVHATVSGPGGPTNLRTVSAEVSRPLAISPFMSVSLKDDGVSPDSAAGDGQFASFVNFLATRAQAGAYRISVNAINENGQRSGVFVKTLSLTRNNSSPRIDSASLFAPDTLILPAQGDTIFFVIRIAASDSDGLADIRQVYLQNLSTSSRDYLFDDGRISRGDKLAGDGLFSNVFILLDGVTQGEYHFILQASDSFADTSRSIPYTLVVQ